MSTELLTKNQIGLQVGELLEICDERRKRKTTESVVAQIPKPTMKRLKVVSGGGILKILQVIHG